jgi:tetratricopeptide (TPR) repeat protein
MVLWFNLLKLWHNFLFKRRLTQQLQNLVSRLWQKSIDKQRFSGYLEFINSLTNCEDGTEKAVYQQYSHTIDELMSGKIEHYDDSTETQRVELWIYIKFVANLMTCENGTEKAVYQQYSHLIDEKLLEIMLAIVEIADQFKDTINIDVRRLRQEANVLTEQIKLYEQLDFQVMELWEQGKIEIATTLAKTALILARETFFNGNINLAKSLNRLASLYNDQERWDEAEPLFKESIAICRTLLSKNPTNDI